MISKEINDWLQVVGLFGVLAGLVFVGMQLRLDRQVAGLEGVAGDSEEMKYWAELVTTNADVWVKGLSGEPLAATEAAKFEVLAGALVQENFRKWQRTRSLSNSDGDRWAQELAFDLYDHPGLLTHWRQWEQRMARVNSGGPFNNWIPAVNNEIRQLEAEGSVANRQ